MAMPSEVMIRPVEPPKEGYVLHPPPSKSVALRAMILGAQAGSGALRGIPKSLPTDLQAMGEGLVALGYPITDAPGTMTFGMWGGEDSGSVHIHVEEGGAPLRFLLALAATCRFETRFTMGERLAQRPLTPLLDALASLGARTRQHDGEITIQGPITGSAVVLDATQSSQFTSALLLAAPSMPEGLDLRVVGDPVSVPYVDLTVRMLEAYGMEPASDPGSCRYSVPAGRPITRQIAVEGDWSAATVLLAAAPMLGAPIRVPGLWAGSSQPDRAFLSVLRELGVHITEKGGEIRGAGPILTGGSFDLGGFPDAAPALAVLGVVAPGAISIRGVPHLRGKESDRIQGLCELLTSVGARAEPLPDGLVVQPGPEAGPGTMPIAVDTREDHRLVMAAALLGLRYPVRIAGIHAVGKSFPGFFDSWPGTSPVIES